MALFEILIRFSVEAKETNNSIQSIYLNFELLKSLVRETQLPSIVPLPTVGVDMRRQDSYRAQASQ